MLFVPFLLVIKVDQILKQLFDTGTTFWTFVWTIPNGDGKHSYFILLSKASVELLLIPLKLSQFEIKFEILNPYFEAQICQESIKNILFSVKTVGLKSRNSALRKNVPANFNTILWC